MNIARNQARMGECCMRTAQGTCSLVDEAIGWQDRMSLEQCDLCHAKGPMSSKSVEFREQYVKYVVATVASRPLAGYSRPVRLAMIAKHLSPPDAANTLLEVAHTFTDAEAVKLAEIVEARHGNAG